MLILAKWRLLEYMAHLVRKRADGGTKRSGLSGETLIRLGGAGGVAPCGMVQGYFCNI